MKVLLIGAGGQVGLELYRQLKHRVDFNATTRDGQLPDGEKCLSLDLSDSSVIPQLIAQQKPDWVINAAAYTAVDQAENDRASAFQINAHAVACIALACEQIGAGLLHYSTDYVFDGSSQQAYLEGDTCAPLGVYGASKLAGEQAIRESGCRHIILRVAWVYAAHGKNFLRTMLRLAADRDQLSIVTDQVGSPTPAHWIAQATLAIVEKQPESSGTWHLSPQGQCSWFEVATEIFDKAYQLKLIPAKPALHAIPASAYPTPAARPAYSVLNHDKLKGDLGIELAPWSQGVIEVLEQIKQSQEQQ